MTDPTIALSPALRDLLTHAPFCHAATLLPDGTPHLTVTWIDTDGTYVLLNTVEGYQKVRNVRRDPRIALNIVHPGNPARVTGIRGRVVEITTEGAAAHIDKLAKRYVGADRYTFGPPGQVRVLPLIAPEKIIEMGG